jgi:hypothetical protein
MNCQAKTVSQPSLNPRSGFLRLAPYSGYARSCGVARALSRALCLKTRNVIAFLGFGKETVQQHR